MSGCSEYINIIWCDIRGNYNSFDPPSASTSWWKSIPSTILAYCNGDEWAHCASLLSYSSTVERMLVRHSSRSRDGHRCLCACSLRPSVSASLRCPPSSLWSCKWIIFYQFTMSWFAASQRWEWTRVMWKQKDIDWCGHSLQRFNMSPLSVMDLVLISVLTNGGFYGCLFEAQQTVYWIYMVNV